MVNWKSARTLEITSFVYKQLVVFLTGFFLWEYVVTFWFEWSLITRKITFKWYYVFYLIGRYSMLCVLCLLFAIDRIMQPINCRVIHPLLTTLGLVASTCATTNLMIRTIIIWEYHVVITTPLVAMSTGQFIFSIYAGTTYAVAHWNDALRTCSFEYEHYSHMASVFVYAVSYDLVILILTVVRIRQRVIEGHTHSRLLPALRDQGILYFAFTSAVNMVAAVVIWMHLNDGMNAVVSPPATTISVILSSHSVISLMQLNNTSGANTPNSARHGARERTKCASQQLTSQIEFPTAIYGANSFDISHLPSVMNPFSLSPASSTVRLDATSSSGSQNYSYPPPSPPMATASSSKHML